MVRYGSATSRPPRTVAPITRPALISTKFLMMYCPSSVGTKGTIWKTWSGKRKIGMAVPTI